MHFDGKVMPFPKQGGPGNVRYVKPGNHSNRCHQTGIHVAIIFTGPPMRFSGWRDNCNECSKNV